MKQEKVCDIGPECKKDRDEETFNKYSAREESRYSRCLEVQDIVDTLPGLDQETVLNPACKEAEYAKENTNNDGDFRGAPKVLFEGQTGTRGDQVGVEAAVTYRIVTIQPVSTCLNFISIPV